MNFGKKQNLNVITKLIIFISISFVVSIFEFHLPFAPSFYTLDFSSAVVLIGGYSIGPLAAIIVGVIKTTLKLICFGSTSAFVGEYVDIIITILFVFPASILYRNHKNNLTAFLGMTIGVFLMTAVGCILNYFLLIPIYAKLTGIPVQSIIDSTTLINDHVTDLKSLILFVTLPFNLLKGTFCSIIAYLCLIPLNKLQSKSKN